MINLTFLGHSAFLLESGSHRLIIDPFLSGNPVAKVSPGDVKVEHVLLTHGHGDHLGDALDIAKANDALVIAPFELAVYCESKGCKAHGMHIGGAWEFPFGRVKLTIAHHGSGIPGPDGLVYGGNPCGFLVTMEGKTIYHAGDTGLFLDMKLIGDMNHIDAALLPIGGNFTMDVADAIKAVEFLKPGVAIPMHFDTFDLVRAEPEEFATGAEALGAKTVILGVGDSHSI